MRQLVSLVKDGQVHYAVVDEDTGQLTPFAEILLPHPEDFDLHEAAVLGTNLISAIGLNGRKPGQRARARAVAAGDQLSLPAVEPERETDRERRNRLAREKYQRQKGGERRPRGGIGRHKGSPTSPGRVQRYISLDEVLAVINRHPEGVTARQIAVELDGKDPPEFWIKRTIENRVMGPVYALRDKGTPMPFRIEHRDEGHGSPSRYFLPVAYMGVGPAPTIH